MLFFQACGFYAPHLFWKAKEAKLLRRLIVDAKIKGPLMDEDEDRGKISCVVKYMAEEKRRQIHQWYFLYFILCEVMNFVNVICQIYLVDEFLGGTFTTYGLEVIEYAQMEQDSRIDPMVKVFPRMTKCTFHRFGSSGDVQRHDALCILPLNIINEKIYIVMWFWFVFLATITGLWLVYRALTLARPDLRYQVLTRRAIQADNANLKYTLAKLKSGDWFLLSMLCKNLDSHMFRVLIEDLAEKLKQKEASRRKSNGLLDHSDSSEEL